MSRVLVVDMSYSPINDIPLSRAIHLLFRESCDETGNYSRIAEPVYNPRVPAEKQSFLVGLANGASLLVPKVIRIIKHIRRVYKTGVPYSKKNIFIRDDDTCAYCWSHSNLTVDHVVPLSKGGSDGWDNTVTACFKCNNRKGDKSPREAGLCLNKRPYQPTVSEFLQKKLRASGLADVLMDIFKS